MTNFFRIATCSCLFAMMSLAGPRLHAEGKHMEKVRASALKVEMIQSDEISVPAAFQVWIYEYVIQQLEKNATFHNV
jgi:hypothetical protein